MRRSARFCSIKPRQLQVTARYTTTIHAAGFTAERVALRSKMTAQAKLISAVAVIWTSVTEAASILARERSLYASEAAQQTVESRTIRSPAFSRSSPPRQQSR